LEDSTRIEAHIKYRHRIARIKLEQMQAKLAKVCKNIKDKNPSLIQHICKEVQKERPYGNALDIREIKASSKS